jgi:hypothetical protein
MSARVEADQEARLREGLPDESARLFGDIHDPASEVSDGDP